MNKGLGWEAQTGLGVSATPGVVTQRMMGGVRSSGSERKTGSELAGRGGLDLASLEPPLEPWVVYRPPSHLSSGSSNPLW